MDLYFIFNLLIILIISLVCSFQDIKYKLISNWIIFTGSGLMLACNFIFQRDSLLVSLFSSIFMLLIFLLARIRLVGKLGWGDIYFSVFIGLSLPFLYSMLAILIATITAFMYILLISIINNCKYKNKKIGDQLLLIKIPFIPFLSIGLIVSFLFKSFLF